MAKVGRVANLYFSPKDRWIEEEVRKLAQIRGVSTTEMFMQLINEGLGCLREPLKQEFKKHGVTTIRKVRLPDWGS